MERKFGNLRFYKNSAKKIIKEFALDNRLKFVAVLLALALGEIMEFYF